MQRKAADRDRWIAGMNRLQQKYQQELRKHGQLLAELAWICESSFGLAIRG